MHVAGELIEHDDFGQTAQRRAAPAEEFALQGLAVKDAKSHADELIKSRVGSPPRLGSGLFKPEGDDSAVHDVVC